MEFLVEAEPDPQDVEFLETQIRREAAVVMGLGDEVELAIFVRDGGRVVAGISGWTWGDCCELQSLWVDPSLKGRVARLAAPRRRRSRGREARVHPNRPLHVRVPGRSTCTSEPATSWSVESRTSHPARMSGGIASA